LSPDETLHIFTKEEIRGQEGLHLLPAPEKISPGRVSRKPLTWKEDGAVYFQTKRWGCAAALFKV